MEKQEFLQAADLKNQISSANQDISHLEKVLQNGDPAELKRVLSERQKSLLGVASGIALPSTPTSASVSTPLTNRKRPVSVIEKVDHLSTPTTSAAASPGLKAKKLTKPTHINKTLNPIPQGGRNRNLISKSKVFSN